MILQTVTTLYRREQEALENSRRAVLDDVLLWLGDVSFFSELDLSGITRVRMLLYSSLHYATERGREITVESSGGGDWRLNGRVETDHVLGLGIAVYRRIGRPYLYLHLTFLSCNLPLIIKCSHNYPTVETSSVFIFHSSMMLLHFSNCPDHGNPPLSTTRPLLIQFTKVIILHLLCLVSCTEVIPVLKLDERSLTSLAEAKLCPPIMTSPSGSRI